MRRTVSALFVAVIAALLSLVLAVPSNAADATPGGPKPLPTDPRYRSGFDYYKPLTQGTPGGPTSAYPRTAIPVPNSVNPSNVGGSWYLNNVKNSRALPSGTANKPLTGKIILPGQTVVKPPSVYGPVVKFAVPGATLLPGLSRLLLGAGFGMGMKVEAPSNWKEIAQTKVSAGCNVSTNSGCTSDDFKQILSVSNCSHTASCVALGAKDADGNLIKNDADWWKDTAVPLLQDLWSAITGQGQHGNSSTDPISDSNSPADIAGARGCYRKVIAFVPGSNGYSGQVITGGSPELGGYHVTNPRPASGTPSAAYWDYDCGQPENTSNLRGTYVTICADVYGNLADGGGAFGTSGTLGTQGGNWDTNGNSKTSLCRNGATIKQIQFRNSYTTAQVAADTTIYGLLDYSEFFTPDTDWDTADKTKISTTADCRVPTGEVYTYTYTTEKIGAFPEPACPEGSDLIRHDIKAGPVNTAAPGNMKTTTLDSGGEVAGAAQKYPTCTSGTGCALSVNVDGQPCTTSRTDCRNWTAVAAQSPSRVECKWGTYTMAISDCYVIAEGYKTDTGVILDPRSGSWVGLDSTGQPIAPAPQPWNPTNPAPVAGQTPTTTPGTGTNTGTNTGGFPTTGTSPSNNCDSPSWSWNPVDWVHSPVVCALKDAFVPKTDVQTRTTALRDKTKTTAPLGWAIDPPIVGPGGGGCPNWVVNVGPVHQNVVCDSSFTAAIVGSRGAMFGLVSSAMVWPLIRSIWYALIPVVRVTPSGGK